MKKKLLETFKRIGGNRLNENTPGYENRKFGDPLPTLASVRAAHEAKSPIKEVEYGMEGGEFDYEGAMAQVNTAVEAIDSIEEDLLRELGSSNSPYAKQAVNQIQRYTNGAQKQIEGIRKMVDKAQRRGEWNV